MSKYDFSYTQNRELSWLSFNERVLEEALEEDVPTLERLSFVGIFASNLDEFFMVRVGSLHALSKVKEQTPDNKSNLTNTEQLALLLKEMPRLYQKKDEIYQEVEGMLREEGIYNLTYEELSDKEKEEADSYFIEHISPLISPLIVDSRHPYPYFENGEQYVVCELSDGKDDFIGVIQVTNFDSNLYAFKGTDLRYILNEELIRGNLSRIYPYEIKQTAVISVTRSADLDLEEGLDEFDDDIKKHFRKALKKRNKLQAVRLEIQGDLEKSIISSLLEYIDLDESHLVKSNSPLKFGYAYELEDYIQPAKVSNLTYPELEQAYPAELSPNRPMIDQVIEQDRLLFYPYETIDPFLRMLKEASVDPEVMSVKITIYRLAPMSRVGRYLLQAAENGKEVVVVMELKARFDEGHNIEWAEKLEEAGCTVIYGFENYKVHSKICQITKYSNGKFHYITQIGTGNYNEKTSRRYTDLSFITTDEEIGLDGKNFFNNMLIGNVEGEYSKLLVAPKGLKPAILSMIDEEIEKAKNGEEALVWLKCNSLTERDVIDKLQEASQAGVKVFMNIRGICCLLPGVEGKTENIEVVSIVGRFLEHPRIYAFGAKDPKIYISSADLMTRNLTRRVEIAVPITRGRSKNKLLTIIDVYSRDTVKGKYLRSDGSYYRKEVGPDGLSAQAEFLELAKKYGEDVKRSYNFAAEDYESLTEEEIEENLNRIVDERLSKMTFWERFKKLFLM